MPTSEIFWDGGGSSPVGTIFAVGRNYADHAAEMKAPADPVVFLKPVTTLVAPGRPVSLPRDRGAVHHELELVVHLGSGGTDLDPEAAGECVDGYGLGLDLTLRDLQTRAKQSGAPWTLSKGFDDSLPVTPFLPANRVPQPEALRFDLRIDGELRQSGFASDMLLPVPRLLAWLSGWITLREGDLVLTGTPAGVGPVEPGQTAELRLLDHLEQTVRFL